MNFDACKSILYSDTLVPDIFITEYMPSMECDYIKIYLYCLFLSKHNKQASIEELSKKLEVPEERVKAAFTYMEGVGMLVKKDTGIVLLDLKEKEINRVYRPKSTSTPEEAILSSERNKKRNRIISAINNAFFQGVMSPSWYTDIDAWFDKYRFEEDVMYALFQHCYDHKGLSKNYILKVADNWYNKKIKNGFDLDKYFIEYQKLKDIKLKIVKKLRSKRMLTEYEEEYVEKWVFEYKYEFDVIELALKKMTSITNPNFQYLHHVLTEWYEKGLRSPEEIVAYEKAKKQTRQTVKGKGKETPVPQHTNFEQRKYEKDDFEKLYEDV